MNEGKKCLCQKCKRQIAVENSISYLSFTLCEGCSRGMANAVRTAIYDFMSIKQYKLPFVQEMETNDNQNQ